MKKPVAVILSLIAVILAVFVIVLAVKYREQTAMTAESRQAEEAVRTQFNAALESIAEIQDSLSVIAPTENRLRGLSQGVETGGRVTQTQKEQMLTTISNLKESIRNTGNRIRELERNLKGSQAEVAGLRRIIDNLKRSVNEREATIQLLTARVDSLNVTVSGLQADVARGQETIQQQQAVIEDKSKEIEDRRREIGTVYYRIGKKNELKKEGIVVMKGGLLGIGKSPQLTGTFDPAGFASIDTDERQEIPIRGKEPKILTAQSRSSYELQVGDQESKLRIVDPAEFRKVRYLVIMVE